SHNGGAATCPLIRLRRNTSDDGVGPTNHHNGTRRRGGGCRRGDRFARMNSVRKPRPPFSGSETVESDVLGIACGTGAALFWAAGFVAARHGIALGFSPADIVFHRFVWAGLVFLPFVARQGFGDLGGGGGGEGGARTGLGGPPLSFLSYAGFLFVPLAHGGVIQPSCATLGGVALGPVGVEEKLPAGRAAGAAVIVAGLAVIGADALATIGTHGLVGDLAFVTAGLMFATFVTVLQLWRIAPARAVAVTSVVSLVDVAIQWLAFGF